MDCKYLKKLNGDEIIKRLYNSDDKLFEDLYICLENIVIGWSIKHALISKEDALELYHVVFIIFIENIQNGKLKNLYVAPSTYLISIAKRKLSEISKRKGKLLLDDSIEDLKRDLEEFQLSQDNKLWEEQFLLFEKAFLKLNEKCQNILIWKYFDNLSFKEIALKLKLKSANVARSEKHRCVLKVRELMNLL